MNNRQFTQLQLLPEALKKIKGQGELINGERAEDSLLAH